MTAPAKGGAGSTPAFVAIACWFDLLGYGEMIDRAGFDPAHANAKRPIARLRAFHRIVAEHSSGGFPTLVMNDGAVAYGNVELVRSDKVWRFIQRCWALYQAATDVDARNGGPGLRAVIAVGLRARGSSRGIVAEEKAIATLIDDLVAGRISEGRGAESPQKLRYRSATPGQLRLHARLRGGAVGDSGRPARANPLFRHDGVQARRPSVDDIRPPYPLDTEEGLSFDVVRGHRPNRRCSRRDGA